MCLLFHAFASCSQWSQAAVNHPNVRKSRRVAESTYPAAEQVTTKRVEDHSEWNGLRKKRKIVQAGSKDLNAESESSSQSSVKASSLASVAVSDSKPVSRKPSQIITSEGNTTGSSLKSGRSKLAPSAEAIDEPEDISGGSKNTQGPIPAGTGDPSTMSKSVSLSPSHILTNHYHSFKLLRKNV